MKEGKKYWLFITFLSLFLTHIYTASAEVSINYVSTTLNVFTPAQGSRAGGTVLYISGINFSPIAGDIQVFFGNYPCNLIAEGSTASMVSCITTAMTNPSSQYSLSVTMYTSNLLPVTCSLNLCQFTYYDYLTPFIYEIFPSTAVGNQQINLAGNHKITNVGDGRSPSASDLRYILIGDTSCSTLDVIQNTISPNSDSIFCNTFLHQEAGEYNMTERVVYGDALYSVRTLRTSFFTGNFYTERIAAVFQASSVATGGNNGHILTLAGVGYQTNPANLTSFKCSLGTVTCKVISNEQGFIQIQLPPYQAGYETAGKLQADANDQNSQQNPYLGSYGFRYTRYSNKYSKNLDSLLLDFRAGTSSETILQDGFQTQLGYIYSGANYFNDYLRGYFFAPVDGSYLFESSVDDTMVVYMSTVQGSSNPANMVVLIRVDNYMYYPEDPYHFIGRANTVTVTLKKGYYYMEVVARDYSGGNFYYVSVSMPQFDMSTISKKTISSTMTSNTSITNPTWKIENIVIVPTTIIPEIITITVNLDQIPQGTTNFNLYYYQNSNGVFTKVASYNIAVKATASQFKSSLGGLYQFTGYGLIVTLQMLDSAGAETLVSANAAKLVYQLTYQWTRPSTYTSLPYCSVTTGIQVVATQAHSAALAGGYTFSLTGVPLGVYDYVLKASSTSIQVGNSLGYLQAALRNYYNAPELEILSRDAQQLPDQLDFNIIYIGVSNPEPVTITTTGMTGGSDNTITSTVTTKRDFAANKPFFNAIPYQFLRVAAALPSLLIQYNHIPAICMDCYFAYQTSSPVNLDTPAFRNGKVGLDITLAAPNAQTLSQFALGDVTVTLYGQPCAIDNGGTTAHFTCTFNTIPHGLFTIPELPAGNEAPRIHVKQFGYAGLAPVTIIPVLAQNIQSNAQSVGALLNEMTISSVTPSQLGINGGVIVTVSGTGFPVDDSGNPTLTITDVQSLIVGNIIVHQVSNTQVTFSFPPQSFTQDKTIHLIYTLTYSGSTYTFTDSTNSLTLSPSLDPSVTALSIQSASPILKQNMVVTGTNFLTDASLMKVYLYFASNNTQKYELGILSADSTTSMTVVLGGGRTGDYYLRVLVIGKGMSASVPANKFSYQIVVSSVSPTTGSIGGGYPMTITGSNFATAKGTTQVFIGDAINNICTITSITATQIVCTVPTLDDAGSALTVLVTGRLIEESRCSGTCIFTYDNTNTIYVTLPSGPVYKALDTVTITTTGTFTATPTVKVGDTAVVLTANSPTSISFAYPALSAGQYLITVNVNGVNAFPLLQTTTNLIIGTPSSTSGSNKGQIISVTGNGFTTISDVNNVIYYNCSAVAVELPIISITRTNVTFEVPTNPGLTCKVNVTMGLTSYPFDYTQSATKTPNVSITDMGSLTYKIVVSNTIVKSIIFIVARYVNSAGGITSSVYPFDWTTSATNTYMATPTGGYLPAGTFYLDVSFATLGFADSSNTNKFTILPTSISAITPTSATVSFGGQGTLTLSSTGFITNQIKNNEVKVCGIRASIVSADQTGLTFKIPPFVNEYTHQHYGIGKTQVLTSSANFISDTVVKTNYAFDNNSRSFYSSDNLTCYTGLDFGAGAKAQITKIRYMPNPAWIRLNNIFDGAVFEGSNDNIAWTTIFAIDAKLVHTGWNTWLDNTGLNKWRYVRFQQTNGTSKCQLAEIEVTGIIYSTTAYSASLPCDVSVNFYGGTSATFSSLITYSDASTAVISSIVPAFGPSTGNNLLTITGTNFATTTSAVSIVIDGIVCVVSSATSTQIQCTTGIRLTPPAEGNSFVATSDGSIIILDCEPFLYMDRWSSTATWGGEVPPRDGDTVYVPQGMTLLVDQSTPFVNAIIVEGGKIVFSDETNMTLDANYFIMIGGQFRAGLPDSPYQHKLTITLHGGYYDKQLPYFGNKVLGCMNCRFNMHGITREPTWTQITSTVNPGGTQLNLLDAVDWVEGQSIAIAATGFNHFESEQRTIVAVSQDKKTITVDTPFTYRHFSGIENHGGKDFAMRAQVALLTRNIVIQGDEMTDIYNHGSHLIFMGKVASGLDATLSYTEIRHCGQPKIIARYCSHFHLAGQVPNSFVRGIAVHHSHARVLTIHGTHYLTVEKNVGYLVEGHNIFIEDGIETHNIIQNNLMISTIASQTMLQSDTSPAGFWITNPLNTVINNHAAGGDFYGFWYEIKPNPDGPSATPNICPTGMQLGQSSNNVAHSQRRFGIRIFNYAARQYPCLPLIDERLVNPWSGNPAIESVFDHYLLWKNEENGVLGENLGYVTLSNFLVIDSGASGMQFYVANVSLQNVTAEKSVIVGFSTGNGPSDTSDLNNVRGIITPRTDGFRADDVTFVNFGEKMTPLQSCSKCESLLFQVTGGKTSFFNNIKFENILGNYIYWNNWRREIFIDEDGTLTKPITVTLGKPQGTSGAVTPFFDHLNIPDHCYNIIQKWDNSTYCDQTITLRSLLYTNPNPSQDFVAQTIRTFKMNALTDSDQPTTYDVQPMIIIKKSRDVPFSWAFPYAVGYNYHTHFQMGIDFQHLSLAPSQYWQETEGIIVKFNYTDQRELYKIGKYYSQALQTPLITGTKDLASLSMSTCLNGDYYHDKVDRHLFVCVTGRNKTIREWIDITGIRCLDFCPKSSPFGERETFTRYWSNATQWPNQILPKAGENVTIPFKWNIILDLSPPALNYVLINGLLYFQFMDLTFQANTIWVQQGGIFIGTPTKPYTYQGNIILNGNKDDLFTVLDPDASGNKMLAVTGALQIYGSPPSVTWTRLQVIAPVGASTITVLNATGWKMNDEIVIGSTYSGRAEDEVFKITSISNNVITLNASLLYEHYGDASPVINSAGGVIDVRAAVGLLTRNIKITRGPDVNNWGCRVQIYSYIMQMADSTLSPVPISGYAFLDGVELNGCGQYGSSNAGLRIQKLGSIVPATTPTVITRSTIRNCNGYCVYVDKSSNVTFDNNIIHNGLRYIAFVLTVTNYAFINNVMIGLRINPDVVAQSKGTGLAPNNAAYLQYIPVNSDTDNVTVTKNLVQGSQDNGFVLPFTSCDKISSYPFGGNTAGSCFAGFVTNVMSGKQCIAAAGFAGYANYIGFIANPPGVLTQVRYSSMFFVDNNRGFTLRFAHEIDDNTLKFTDSYFMGYSRPNCPNCYSNTKLSYCNNGYAIRMLTTTISGQQFPFNKNISGFDVICTQQAFDAKAFLTNITFQNYQYGTNAAVPYCNGMSVFRKHDLASDATGVHNLYNSPCINCDLKALVYFSPANPDWRGWSGGCGELDCTGSINYFIHDHTGHYTKAVNNNQLQPSQLLANNQPIGGNQTACQRVEQWNGYWCKFEELAVLQYQSIAADYNKRMVWPIYLKYDGGNWNSTTNGWREWVWIAPGDPAETRLARFWSVVRLGQFYNMTYSSQPPSDAVYQIQKRQLPSGNPNDWVMARIYFPVPNVVLVRASTTTGGENVIVPGFQQVNGSYPSLSASTGVCGANYYDFAKNIINFVVNGKDNCKVRLTLSSFVQLTVRFQVEMTNFLSNNGPANVLSKIVAFLNIDPSQIKIVSINPGSVILGFQILPPSIFDPVNTTTNSSDPFTNFMVNTPRDPIQDSNDLNTFCNDVTSALKAGSLDLGYNVLNISSTVKVVATGGSFITVCPQTYIYNETSQTCFCDDGFIEINNVCVACETIGNSTVDSDPINKRRCICKLSYIWSDTTKSCYCAGSQSIVDINGTCFNCSSLLLNSTGNASSTSACKCKTSFSFDPSSNTCKCPDANSYIVNNTCYGCSNFANGTGLVANATNTSKNCECLPTYTYQLKACLCPTGYFVSLTKTCVQCLNATCRCPTGKIFKPATSACGCPVDNSIYLNSVCIPCTSENMTGAINTNGTRCVCKSNLVWLENKCQCSAKTMIIFNGACISCNGTNFNYSGKGAVSPTECSCKNQFTWVPSNGTCVCGVNSMFTNNTCFNCSQFANTAVSTSSAIPLCLCLNNLVFDIKLKTCGCPANNTIMRQQTCILCSASPVNGLNRTNATTCTCSAALNLIWNGPTQTCICKAGYYANGNKCVNCQPIAFSTGASTLGISCVCKPTFIWNPNSNTCTCDSNSIMGPVVANNQSCVSCNAFIGSSGIDPIDPKLCVCLGSLTWDSLKKLCVCPSYTINVTIGRNTTKVTTYFIITANASCVPCNVSTDPYISGSVDAYNCKCANPYIWDNLRSKCVKCTDLTNGQAKLNGTELSCPCKPNFFFDVYTNLCIATPKYGCVSANISNCIDCRNIQYADTSRPPGPANRVVVGKDNSAIAKQYSSLSLTLSKYSTYQCYCSAGFELDPTRKRCATVFE